MTSRVRYVYAVWTDARARGAKAFTRREVPGHLVARSTDLTEAARTRAAAYAPPRQLTFDGLSEEDVASVFAAAARGEVGLSGGRFTREPTLWSPRRRL